MNIGDKVFCGSCNKTVTISKLIASMAQDTDGNWHDIVNLKETPENVA